MVFDKKEYYKQYYLRNKDKYKVAVKKWQDKNKDRIKDYRKKYNSLDYVKEKSRIRSNKNYKENPLRREYIKNFNKEKRKDKNFRLNEYLDSRERRKSPRPYDSSKRDRIYKWRKKNDFKVIAEKLSLRKIKILYPFCLYCGSSKSLHRHHEDYSKPLNVIILCSNCHKKVHRKHPMKEFVSELI